MIQRATLKNWENFVEYIVKAWEQGATETELSEEFSGSVVTWTGKIVEIKISERFAPGIAIEMKNFNNELRCGKRLRTDYLFLNVDDNTVTSWKNCKLNTTIKFRAVIESENKVFPAIQISIVDDDPEAILTLGLYKAECIQKGE